MVQANIDVFVNTQQAAAQLAALQKQISSLNASMVASQQGQMGNLGLNKVLKDFKGVNAEILNVASATATLDKALSKGQMGFGKSFGVIQRSLRGVGTEMELATQKANILNATYQKLGSNAANSMTSVVRVSGEMATRTQILTQQINMATRALDLMGTRVLNWGKNMQWAGRQLMVGLTVPLGIFAGVAVAAFMDVERAFINFQRVYGDFTTSEADTARMTQRVKELAIELSALGYTAQETIELAAKAAATGAMGDELENQVRQATNLATLGQISQEQSLNTIISLNTAFGLAGKELEDAVNFLNAVENQTVLALEDISEAIPLVAPVIKGLGGDVKDLAVMLTAMREGGINANEGANALKTSLARLVTPTKQATETANQFGISLTNIVENNAGDLMAMIYSLSDAMSGLSELQKQQLLSDVFGKRQFARMGAMFSNLAKDGSQAAEAMKLVNAEASDLAALSEKELKAVEQSTTMRFKSSLEELKIALEPIGQMALEALIPILDMAKGFLEAFNNLSDGVKKFAGALAVVGAAIIPGLLMGIGLFANLIGNLINGFSKVVKGVTFMASKMGLLAKQTGFLTNEQLEAELATNRLSTSQELFTTSLMGTNTQLELQSRLLAELQVQYNALAAQVNAGRGAGVMGAFAPRAPLKFATGGKVPGTGNKDTIPALLTPGEMVINKSASQKHGAVLHAINSGTVGMYAEGLTDTRTRVYGASGREYDIYSRRRSTVVPDEATLKKLEKQIARLEAYGESAENIEEIISMGVTDKKGWSTPFRHPPAEVRRRVDDSPLARRIRSDQVSAFAMGATQRNHQETRGSDVSSTEFLKLYEDYLDDKATAAEVRMGATLNDLARDSGIDKDVIVAEPKGLDVLRAEQLVNQTGKRPGDSGGGLGYVPSHTARMDALGLSGVRVGPQMELAAKWFDGDELDDIHQGLFDSYDRYREKILATNPHDVFAETETPEFLKQLEDAQAKFAIDNPDLSPDELAELGPKGHLLGEMWDEARAEVAENNDALAKYTTKLKENTPLLSSKVKLQEEEIRVMNERLQNMPENERQEKYGDLVGVEVDEKGRVVTRHADGSTRVNKVLGTPAEDAVGKKKLKQSDALSWKDDTSPLLHKPRGRRGEAIAQKAAEMETKRMMERMTVTAADVGADAYRAFETSFLSTAKMGYMDEGLARHLAQVVNMAEGPAKQEAMQLATNLMNALGPDATPGMKTKAQKEWNQFALSLGDGLEMGLIGSQDDAGNAAEALERFISSRFARAAQIKSPSKKWYRYGVDLVRGLIGGMDSQKSAAAASAQSVEAAASGGMAGGIKNNKFLQKSGRATMKVAKGMGGSVGGVGIMAASMIPMMIPPNEQGKVMGMDPQAMMGGMMALSMLPMLTPVLAKLPLAFAGLLGPIAAVAAALAAIGFAMWKWRDSVDKAAKSAYDSGKSLASFGSSLDKITKLTGSMSLQEQQAEYRAGLTVAEKEQAAQFRDQLETEDGKKMVAELVKMNSVERDKAIANYVVSAVQSGMMSNQDAATFAKELGMAVGDNAAGTKAAQAALEAQEGAAEMLKSANAESQKILSSASDNASKITYQEAARQIGAATAGMKSYNEVIAKAEIDYREGTLTYNDYIAIIREAAAAQDRYNKIISGAFERTTDTGATTQALKRGAEDIIGTEGVKELEKQLGKSISGWGFNNSEKDRFNLQRSKYEADYIDRMLDNDERFAGKSNAQIRDMMVGDETALKYLTDEARNAANIVKEMGPNVERASYAMVTMGKTSEEITTLLNGIMFDPTGNAARALQRGELDYNTLNAELMLDQMSNGDEVRRALGQSEMGDSILGRSTIFDPSQEQATIQYLASIEDAEKRLAEARKLNAMGVEKAEALATARLNNMDERYDEYISKFGQEGVNAIDILEGGDLTEEQVDYLFNAYINGSPVDPQTLLDLVNDVSEAQSRLAGVSNQLLVDLDIDPNNLADQERYADPATIDRLNLAETMMNESLPEEVDRTYASKFIVMDGNGDILSPEQMSKNLVQVKKAWNSFSKKENKSEDDIVEYAIKVMPKVSMAGGELEFGDKIGAQAVYDMINDTIGLDKFNTLDIGTQMAILNIAIDTNITGAEDAARALYIKERLATPGISIQEAAGLAAEAAAIDARKEANEARMKSMAFGNAPSGSSGGGGGGGEDDKDWFEQLDEDAKWATKMYGRLTAGEEQKAVAKIGWIDWLRRNTKLSEEAIQAIVEDEEAMEKLRNKKGKKAKVDFADRYAKKDNKKYLKERRDEGRAQKDQNEQADRLFEDQGRNRVTEFIAEDPQMLAAYQTNPKKTLKVAREIVAANTTQLDLVEDRIAREELLFEAQQARLNLLIAEQEYAFNIANIPLQERNVTLNAQIAALQASGVDPIREKIKEQQYLIKQIEREYILNEKNLKKYQDQTEELQRRVSDMRRALDLRQREGQMLDHDLKLMSWAEQDINDAYEKRVETLDKVLEINQAIAQSQQDQLGLADALSRGDIGAAAAAAQQMQQNQMQFANDQARYQLERAKDNAIDTLTGAESGMTREQIEDRQRELEEDSYYTNLQIRDLEDQIYDLSMKIRAENDIIDGYKDKIQKKNELIRDLEWDILNFERDKIWPLEQQVAANDRIIKQNEAEKLQLTETARIDLAYSDERKKMTDARNAAELVGLKIQEAMGKSIKVTTKALKVATRQANEFWKGIESGNGSMEDLSKIQIPSLSDALASDVAAAANFTIDVAKPFEEIVAANSTYNIPTAAVSSGATSGIMSSVTNNYNSNNNVVVNTAPVSSPDAFADAMVRKLVFASQGGVGSY